MNEIPKTYEPQAVEDKWYQFWLDEKCFVANPDSPKPAYSIVIPPPNVTGMLHMGHVLNNTIQDILSRKARMDGKEVLWLPGTDHAGIATQVQVEKALKKEERKTKHDLGREEFLKRVWAWKEKHGGIIINQLKKLGCSCDWTRERFTMDPEYSRCVQKVFVELYKKGLIYRGKRMVNWCPVSQTALSDEEVEMKPQKGFMYHFKVQVLEKSEIRNPKSEIEAKPGGPAIDSEGRVWLTIATTRPETIPGDTAVAVNPKDPRYTHLIGKHVIRPLPIQLPLEKKLIPIIGDEHVDFEFGTGVLKVTPAHDKADFEIGQRHKLPVVDIMNANGTMNELAGESLAGLDRFEARDVAVERLKELGVLMEEKTYENNVGFSQRADVPIEPRLSEQWFLKYPKTRESFEVVMSDRMLFHPYRWRMVYAYWLQNIKDWCISRQLWWGHQIPAWHRKVWFDENPHFANPDETETGRKIWYTDPDSKRLYKLDRSNIHVATEPPSDPENWKRDPDVLDTWFSSWLWPFATMGWPEQTETLKKFYPTTDLVTGPDIIFFWVARMIMAGYEFMGDLPFRNVYFTGIIRDKQGRKMSKTLGNSPDPLELISKYGADALRFGTMRSAPLGQDVLFDEKDVELGRNFCNKLWNACRFRQMVGQRADGVPPADQTSENHNFRQNAGSTFEVQGEIDPKLLTADDKWILLKLDQAIREITDALNTYNFSTAVLALYRFFWSEYCDWYVEASKAVLGKSEIRNPKSETDAQNANKLAVLDFVLSHTLRLFHPFLPFITEELWHGMGYSTDMPEDQGGKSIMFAPWPKPLDGDFKAHYRLTESDAKAVESRNNLVTQGRNLRRAGNIPASKKVKFIFKPVSELPANDIEVMRLLLNAEAVEVNPNYQPTKGTPTVVTPLGELCLPLEGYRDVAAEKERLAKELEKIESEISKAEKRLANPNFAKAPPHVQDEHKRRLAEWQAKREHAKTALEALGG